MKKLIPGIALLICILCTSFALASCTGTDNPDSQTSADSTTAPLEEIKYTVSVVDNLGNAVVGAEVSVGDITVTTNALGNAYFNLKGSNHAVTVKASDDYEPDTKNYTFANDSTSLTITLNAIHGGRAYPIHITSDDPIEITLDAGQTKYYSFFGTKTIRVIGGNSVVTFGSETYNAVDGVLEATLSSSDVRYLSSFGVSEKDGQATVFTLEAVYLPGSVENPHDLTGSIGATISVATGESKYFKYVAEKDGVLVYSCNDPQNSSFVNNLTQNRYGANTNGEKYSFTSVKAGDEIQIGVGSLKTGFEGTVLIDFKIAFYAATEDDPVVIPSDIETFDVLLLKSSDILVYKFEGADGKTVILEGANAVASYNGQIYTANEGKLQFTMVSGQTVFAIASSGTSEFGEHITASVKAAQ